MPGKKSTALSYFPFRLDGPVSTPRRLLNSPLLGNRFVDLDPI
jgi:hypothetical protein